MEKNKIMAIVVLVIIAIVLAAQIYITEKHGGESAPSHKTSTVTSTTSTLNPPKVVIPKTVIIYDSLAREFPDSQRINEIKSLLEKAGYTVIVYSSRNATLDPLVALGKYGIAIIRAHGAYNGDPNSGKPLGTYVYTGLYLLEAEAIYGVENIKSGLEKGYYAPAVIPRPGVPLEKLPKYLAVSPLFFKRMAGEMNNTIVIYTGCYGFQDDKLAKAILSKGALAFIGWSGNVTWLHGDEFLVEWAKDLAQTGDPLKSIILANETVGVDPHSKAVLKMMVRNNG